MITTPKTIIQSLSGALRRLSVIRIDIDRFKMQFLHLLDSINDKETEEFHKNLVSEFLKATYYNVPDKPKHSINTKGRNDLVIHNGETPKTSVGVIIEAKKPTNSAEMPSLQNLNVKAFHELILYYLRERITAKNLEIKHLVITNVYEWFIFDVQEIDRLFAQNKTFVQQFQDFLEGRLADNRTDFFYKQIAEPFIKNLQEELSFTHFSLKDYEKFARNNTPEDDKKLLELYKIFAPEHLLKLPFVNDSNTLDKGFYFELLHIMGLKEVQVGGKKLIQRNPEKERNSGSILENAIMQLDSLDKISRLPNSSAFGNNKEERFFNVAMELSITWINRILFLKLLEAQLRMFNRGSSAYRFLNTEKISEMNDLDRLFFQVLAKRHENRPAEVQRLFIVVPYLNSSLFEITDLEQVTITVSNLRTDVLIPIHSQTVLKDRQGNKLTGQLNLLDYLFGFLDAYDFGTDSVEMIRESNKSLITASVLGLIFEKINGYKDGSFFTPSFITMYMCKETIRKAVVQKFNEVKKWNCKTIKDLHEKIEDKKEANQIINSLKICDPAVGSGHFLVSVLNELIAIKSELKILLDREGRKLRDYKAVVENDELIVMDIDYDDYFKYNFRNDEAQKVQEAIFHEKQTIIENCLFGVDINPNSVKICRLRLWIELLKNAYYKSPPAPEGGVLRAGVQTPPSGAGGLGLMELETLPNIDINIKVGNSLVSRFDLHADLKQALKRSNGATPRWTLETYRNAIANYQHTTDKEQKREIEGLITAIKADFRAEISKNDSRLVKKRKLEGEMYLFANQNLAFETEKEKKEKAKKIEKLTQELASVEAEIEEMKANRIFENAFEWRFEFPEVLNEDGDFVGFDVIIGNPPYIALQRMWLAEKAALESLKYQTFEHTGDVYMLFYEKGMTLLKQNGLLAYITSRQWMQASYGKKLRKYLADNTNPLLLIDLGQDKVFDNATVFVNILLTENAKNQYQTATYLREEKKENEEDNKKNSWLDTITEYFTIRNDLGEDSWTLTNATSHKKIIESKGKAIEQLIEENILLINRGITTGFNDAFHIPQERKDELIAADAKNAEIIKPLLRGKDIKRYHYQFDSWYMLFIPWHFPLHEDSNIMAVSLEAENAFIRHYPTLYKHFEKYKTDLTNRNQAETSIRYEWYALQRYGANFWREFEKPKIVWIEISDKANYAYDDKGMYLTNSAYFLTVADHSPYSLKYLLAILNSKVSDYYFSHFSAKIAGGRMRYTKQYVEKIIIPHLSKEEQQPFEMLVDYILFLKSQNLTDTKDKVMSYYFEHIIDLAVFEVFFPNEMDKAGFHILATLQNLPAVTLENIRAKYKDFQDITHPIRNAVSTIKNYRPFGDIYEHLKYKS